MTSTGDSKTNGSAQTIGRSTFDKFVLILGIVESLSTLPQIYQIWVNKQVAGVSVFTWFSYSLIECIWLAYGFRQKDKALIGGSISWGIMELLVAIGALVK
jgi:uncharacterized protein with PQ loop repeat